MRAVAMVFAGLVASGCAGPPGGGPGGWAGACDRTDGALNDAAFVIATAPAPGARVASGFPVAGCSRTFESTVVWQLFARDGTLLGRGVTSGGGVDGPGAFSFAVPFEVDERQIGRLEVFEEDVSNGEGFPPGRTVLPLVLLP